MEYLGPFGSIFTCILFIIACGELTAPLLVLNIGLFLIWCSP